MATEVLQKRQAYVELSTGATTTKRVTMGTMSKDGWDAAKALNIVMALDSIFNYSISSIPMVATYNVME